MSSRTNKAKEIMDNQNVAEVINLWNTTKDDIQTISNKTGLTKKEVDMILISHEATKLNKQIYKKPNYVKFDNAVIDISRIVAVYQKEEIEKYIPEFRLSTYRPADTQRRIRQHTIIVLDNSAQIVIDGPYDSILKKIKIKEEKENE